VIVIIREDEAGGVRQISAFLPEIDPKSSVYADYFAAEKRRAARCKQGASLERAQSFDQKA
jgi:hypothetical protein